MYIESCRLRIRSITQTLNKPWTDIRYSGVFLEYNVVRGYAFILILFTLHLNGVFVFFCVSLRFFLSLVNVCLSSLSLFICYINRRVILKLCYCVYILNHDQVDAWTKRVTIPLPPFISPNPVSWDTLCFCFKLLSQWIINVLFCLPLVFLTAILHIRRLNNEFVRC